MARLEQSLDHGVLQEFVEGIYRDEDVLSRLDVVLEAESYGLNRDLMEIVELLPPGRFTREKLCGQFNSSLSSHGWGYFYGTVH